MGGGLYFKTYEKLESMDSAVNSLLSEKGEDLSIEYAGEVSKEFSYKPVKVIEKLARE